MMNSLNDGFPYYIELVDGENFTELFSQKESITLLKTLSEEKACYRYATGKWSIKQIIGHLTDHERIMMYRCLRFSRKDTTVLSGYDEQLFVNNSRFDQQSLSQLLNDFENVRNASLSFIDSLSLEQLSLKGTAWKFELSVEEFLKATVGHELHHLEVIKQRYLS